MVGGDAVSRRELESARNFLLEHELAYEPSSAEEFLPLDTHCRLPEAIDNAIIDVGEVPHDFAPLIGQLDLLGCRYLQVRCYSSALGLEFAGQVAQLAAHTSIESISLVLVHSRRLSHRRVAQLLRAWPLITSVDIYGAPQTRAIEPQDADLPLPEFARRQIRYHRAALDSELACGVIAPASLTPPDPLLFAQLQAFNGCLHGKIAVDRNGDIRNCPSMRRSFGNIGTTSLVAAASAAEFRTSWRLNKDLIATCRDCEFRYACTDCRAYVEDPDDPRSKPLKCGYDPYIGEWQDWRSNVWKMKVFDHYRAAREGGEAARVDSRHDGRARDPAPRHIERRGTES